MDWFFTQAKCADATPTGAPLGTPPGAAVSAVDPAAKKKTDFLDLPTPVKYEELQREIMSECSSALRLHFFFWG